MEKFGEHALEMFHQMFPMQYQKFQEEIEETYAIKSPRQLPQVGKRILMELDRFILKQS